LRCQVIRAGLVEYGSALSMQEKMVEERAADERPDTLLLLEHPPVITLGRGAHPEHVLSAEGVAVHETPRGGDVTFHGPGQWVGYPILKLARDRQDVRRYVHDVEAVVIRALADYGIAAERVSGLRGIFVGRDKVAAVGVRISRWVTSHGFALNVNTDLRGFEAIVPCGITDRGVTSMERLLGRPVSMDDVAERIVARFGEVFGLEMVG